MKRSNLVFFLLLSISLAFVACNRENVTPDPTFDEVQLREGIWTVDQVTLNSFDGQGFLTSSQIIPFGEGKEGGICTFEYTDDAQFILTDNGNVYTYKINLDGRVLYADNGDEWGIRKLEDNKLEVVLRGEEVNNPCAFSASGAVYSLTRGVR
ncbi:MAG: hypothetical protein AAGN35_22180 [Bacteroidota bacterium]